jgi:hypothetical protein
MGRRDNDSATDPFQRERQSNNLRWRSQSWGSEDWNVTVFIEDGKFSLLCLYLLGTVTLLNIISELVIMCSFYERNQHLHLGEVNVIYIGILIRKNMQMSINMLWYKQTEEKKGKFEDTKRMFFYLMKLTWFRLILNLNECEYSKNTVLYIHFNC